MGTNGTKKNTGKLNTNAEDKIDDIPIDVETPAKDITINHHMHLTQHHDSLTTNTDNSRETLEGIRTYRPYISTGKKSNLILSKTIKLEENMYIPHRIRHSQAHRRQRVTDGEGKQQIRRAIEKSPARRLFLLLGNGRFERKRETRGGGGVQV